MPQDNDTRRLLRVMREYRIGIKALHKGWWPELSSAKLTTKQLITLGAALEDEKPFEDPLDAVRVVSSALGLANFP